MKARIAIFCTLISISILAGVLCFPFKNPSTKIYDCFLFFNELEMLDIRFAELYDQVDHFVLVESTETFQGNPKPLIFAENKERFGPYLDKIIHVTINEHYETTDPWQREYYQRNQIMRGLKDCNKHDIIIVSDADEILKQSKIKELAPNLEKNQILSCQQKMYLFYLDRPTRYLWNGSMVTTYGQLQRTKPYALRKMRNLKKSKLKRFSIRKAQSLKDMGWHFNSLGGYERYLKKLAAFSHTECKVPDSIEEMRKHLVDVDTCQIDESYPQYVTQNLDKLTHFLDSFTR
ncbi:MAG TPA: hypothetical protein PLO43_00510 [Chlamydiales bacterium]|nr:hypothetical protein [Chlamydiales bacterium]HPE84648.1 hypothetical protein [Chlamydiales bacterium]